MGIGPHEFNFLRYAKHLKDFGQTMTIGRQGLYVAESSIRHTLALASDYKNGTYCDQLLLDQFGASKVDSRFLALRRCIHHP
jgi:hypothetical protein